VARDALPGVVDLALARPDLDLTPPRPGADELLALYEAAW
jgi:hypothetical protein